MYVTMALEYERKCTLLCMLDQTRKTPLLSQHHDEGTPICIAALENYPYLAYLQKKIWLRHPGGQLRFSIIILVNAHWKIESERTKLIPEGPGDSWRH